ncbi:hypothetical protein Hanom_Chr02g00142931 [Helianthus anomalus]
MLVRVLKLRRSKILLKGSNQLIPELNSLIGGDPRVEIQSITLQMHRCNINLLVFWYIVVPEVLFDFQNPPSRVSITVSWKIDLVKGSVTAIITSRRIFIIKSVGSPTNFLFLLVVRFESGDFSLQGFHGGCNSSQLGSHVVRVRRVWVWVTPGGRSHCCN